jgi:hypothetical protein
VSEFPGFSFLPHGTQGVLLKKLIIPKWSWIGWRTPVIQALEKEEAGGSGV